MSAHRAAQLLAVAGLVLSIVGLVAGLALIGILLAWKDQTDYLDSAWREIQRGRGDR